MATRVDYEQRGRTYAQHRRADWQREYPAGVEGRIVERLGAALGSGAWDAEHGHLRELDQYDGALRLVISEPA